jgi:membrane associated rhomboid family serine protease
MGRGWTWGSMAVMMAIVIVASFTLAPHALVAPGDLAWTWGTPVWPNLLFWWVTHVGWVHAAGNLVVLLLFAPALERYVGTWRMLVAVIGGNVVGILGHVALSGPRLALLGASGAVYAVVVYSLVVGWHCPFEFQRPRPWLLWPATLFHGLVLVEGLRWGVQVAAGYPAGSAGVHLGGIAAGVLASGLLHHRWPGGPASRRARGSGWVMPSGAYLPAPAPPVTDQPTPRPAATSRGPAHRGGPLRAVPGGDGVPPGGVGGLAPRGSW